MNKNHLFSAIAIASLLLASCNSGNNSANKKDSTQVTKKDSGSTIGKAITLDPNKRYVIFNLGRWTSTSGHYS